MSRKVCSGRVSSPFGMRHDPLTRAWIVHNGIDIATASGTIVYCPCEGEVAAMYSHKLGGKTLILKGNDGLRYGFCHLSGYNVVEGQAVTLGQSVARSGNSGRTTGPHLHFSVKSGGHWVDGLYQGGEWIDPQPYLELDK